jgi:hypothetical protein
MPSVNFKLNCAGCNIINLLDSNTKKKKSKDKKTNIKKIKTKLVGLNAIWMTSKK